ncbi:MAG: GAF and ANTAR domain-containing protein [Acidimicrobiales bacterium]
MSDRLEVPMSDQTLLTRTFVELTDTLVADFDVVEFLTLLSHRCVELFSIDAAGIVLTDHGGNLRLTAASNDATNVLELFEIQNEEGPCLDCYRTGGPVVNQDLADNGRWPRFSRAALDGGFRSVHALPMRLRDATIGSLNLFATSPGPLPEGDLIVSQAFADVATISILQYWALGEARMVTEQLGRALQSRVVIEQAKGVLAERLGLEMAGAFEQLRRYARNRNLHLNEVARAVVNGSLPATDL